MKSSRIKSLTESLLQIRHGIAANLFVQIAIIAIQLGSIPALSSAWGAELYGTWLLLTTIPTYLAFSDLGMTTAAGNLMTIDVSAGDEKAARQKFQTTIVCTLLVGTILLCATVVALNILSAIDNKNLNLQNYTTIILVIVAYSILCMLDNSLQSIFKASNRYGLGTTLFGVSLILENALVVIVACSGGTLIQASISLLFTRLLSTLVKGTYLKFTTKWMYFIPNTASVAVVKELMHPSMAAMAIPISQALYLHAPGLILGATTTTSNVAVLATTRTLTRIALQAISIFNHALMPAISRRFGAGDQQALKSGIGTSIKTSLLIATPILLTLAFTGQQIVASWTNGHIQMNQDVLFILIASTGLTCIWHPASNIFLAVGKQYKYAFFYLGTTVACILGYFLLKSNAGIIGAALCMLAIDAVMLLKLIFVIKKETSK